MFSTCKKLIFNAVKTIMYKKFTCAGPLNIQNKYAENVKMTYLICEPASLSNTLWHHCWWLVLRVGDIRIKLKSEDLYGKEL